MKTIDFLLNSSLRYKELSSDKVSKISKFCCQTLTYFDPVKNKFINLVNQKAFSSINQYKMEEIEAEIRRQVPKGVVSQKDRIINLSFSQIDKWLGYLKWANRFWIASLPIFYFAFEQVDIRYIWLGLVPIYISVGLAYNRRLAALLGRNYLDPDFFHDTLGIKGKVALQISSSMLILSILTLSYLDLKIWWAIPLIWLILVRGLIKPLALHFGSIHVMSINLVSFIEESLDCINRKIWFPDSLTIKLNDSDLEFELNYYEKGEPLQVSGNLDEKGNSKFPVHIFIFLENEAQLAQISEEFVNAKVDVIKVLEMLESDEKEFVFEQLEDGMKIVVSKEDYWSAYNFSGNVEMTKVEERGSNNTEVEFYRHGVLVEE